MKLIINNKEKFGKVTNMWKLKHILYHWVKEDIKIKMRIYFEMN